MYGKSSFDMHGLTSPALIDKKIFYHTVNMTTIKNIAVKRTKTIYHPLIHSTTKSIPPTIHSVYNSQFQQLLLIRKIFLSFPFEPMGSEMDGMGVSAQNRFEKVSEKPWK